MRKIYFSGLLLLMVASVFAQKLAKPSRNQLTQSNPDKIEFMKGKMIVCPGNFEDANTYVPMAKEVEEALRNQKARGGAGVAKATFIVTYNGFSPAAQRAFQAAVDIWANLITSPIPIRITATWRAIDSGTGGGTTLGQASPGDFTRNFPGQQRAGTWYPIALAEKISGQELNSINEPDITADFNSTAPWYLGLAAPPANQFDFTSVVLHELCHGLGFTSSMRVSGNNGSWGFGTGSPFVYDHFLENGSSQQLLNATDFANNSNALRQQLLSGNLFFNSPAAIAAGEKPKIFAPTTYQPGSSISHVNDATYPSGNANSLMTSAASLREVIRDPGPLVKAMFADMGWKSTSLIHPRIKNIETAVSKVTIRATITSDTSIVAGSARVFYTENDTIIANAKPIVMVRAGTTNNYSADVPVTKANSIIRYYLVVEDNYKRKNTAPAEAPTRGFYGFSIGTADVSPPFVTTDPPTIIPSTGKPDVFANIEDTFEHGIDTVYVEYKIGGVDQKPFGLKKYNPATDDKTYSQGRNDVFAYLAKAPFTGLKLNDRVQYRIVAIDKAKAKNRTTLPSYFNTPGTNVTATPDYFEFFVNDLKTQTPVQTFKTDFNTSPNDDFAKIGGWDITQPAGFTNGALHSAHPYKNGGNEDLQSNTIALLRTPIEVKEGLDSATISFDEIVLVEPGEKDAVFPDTDFYDYVVVEGSYDGGASWVPFEDGYDANANADWLKAFNTNLVRGTVLALGGSGRVLESVDSRGTATAALYKKRSIKILANGEFVGGDIILIRFRLFSDELTYGWGWAIDNLQIQVPPPPPVLAVEAVAEKSMTLSPNPSPDEIFISTSLAKPGRVKMEVISSKGVKVMEKEYLADVNNFNQKIDLADFSAGSYIVRLHTENGIIVKRFVVNK